MAVPSGCAARLTVAVRAVLTRREPLAELATQPAPGSRCIYMCAGESGLVHRSCTDVCTLAAPSRTASKLYKSKFRMIAFEW